MESHLGSNFNRESPADHHRGEAYLMLTLLSRLAVGIAGTGRPAALRLAIYVLVCFDDLTARCAALLSDC
jgi:hypothetical protein